MATNVLHRLVEKASVEAIQKHLDHKAEVNKRDGNGDPPILIAAKGGRVEVVSLLLAYQCDPQLRGQGGTAALHMASAGGYVEICEKLLKAGVDVDIRTDNGWTPLHFAAESGRTEVIKCLIRRRADVSKRVSDRNNTDALALAIEMNHSEAVNYLMDAIQQKEISPVVCQHEVDSEKSPTKSQAQVLQTHNLPSKCDLVAIDDLHEACRAGQLVKFKHILQHCSDPKELVNSHNSYQRTGLHLSSLRGHVGIARELLKKGCQVDATDADGNTALHLAHWKKESDMVQLLLKFGASVNIQNNAKQVPTQMATPEGDAIYRRTLGDIVDTK